ncbi:hypothetical protein [Moraxella bovis]|uniref:hypothetical protein n=1 Tax=Moraxella bovis TaxID=476 RepID=UPI0022267F3D|nr:hypothetical protein [Moraxella bovis]UZA37681.1 hypothetical protein LP101_11060 [Moraxella bovis]
MSNPAPEKNIYAQLRIMIKHPLTADSFRCTVIATKFAHFKGVTREDSQPIKMEQVKFKRNSRHDKNGYLAIEMDPVVLFEAKTGIDKVVCNPNNRSNNVGFETYQKGTKGDFKKVRDIYGNWFYEGGTPTVLTWGVTQGVNGQSANTHKTQNINTNAPKASFTAFVGGAMDKYKFSKERFERYIPKKYEYLNNPTNIMLDCLTDFKKILPRDVVNASFEYYGYEEAYGNYSIAKKYGDHLLLNLMSDIKEILKKEPKTQINLVGHSFRGWNVAGLAEELSKNKICKVNCLITIDPVGTRLSKILLTPTPMGFVGKADIYIFEPDPISNIWINVYSKPTTNDDSDIIADLGGRWYDDDTAKATYQVTSSAHHYQAQTMLISSKYFKNNTHSASDILINELKKVRP